MRTHLEKVGAVGTLFGAMAVAAPCCLPLLASAGAALGLGVLVPYQTVLIYVVQAFVALAVVGAVVAYRMHRKIGPLLVLVPSAATLFYVYNFNEASVLVYYGLGGLVVSAVWNTVEGRRCAACKPVQHVQMQSTITCPKCGHKATETMPTDSCQFFYECKNCKAMLKPAQGDCCVFCSYGSVKCPPIQAQTGCC